MLLSSVILLISLVNVIKSQCTWTQGTNALDLRHFLGEEIKGNAQGYDYLYTPCRDQEGCGPEKGMAVQQDQATPSQCSVLSYWGAGPDGGTDGNQVQPEYNPFEGDGAWLFNYNNGDECSGRGPRRFIAQFLCDKTVDDYSVDSVSEPDICQYEMKIRTKCACLDTTCPATGGGGSSSSSGLSGGWIFIIILLCGLFLYFVVGWIICGAMNKDGGFGDVKGNIPHSAFWCALPSLVMAGCMVTKEAIMGLFNKDEKSEPIVDTEE